LFRLKELFRLVDNAGDGSLSAEEFVQAMELPSVQQYL
jgi:Ca2+-binding EF-hand superfamily protein